MENTTLYFLLCFTYLLFKFLSKLWTNIYNAYLVKHWNGNMDIFEQDFDFSVATVATIQDVSFGVPYERKYQIQMRKDLFDSYMMHWLDKLGVTPKLVAIVHLCVRYILHFICCDCAIYRRPFNNCNNRW
jgi:hypothetical protein